MRVRFILIGVIVAGAAILFYKSCDRSGDLNVSPDAKHAIEKAKQR